MSDKDLFESGPIFGPRFDVGDDFFILPGKGKKMKIERIPESIRLELGGNRGSISISLKEAQELVDYLSDILKYGNSRRYPSTPGYAGDPPGTTGGSDF